MELTLREAAKDIRGLQTAAMVKPPKAYIEDKRRTGSSQSLNQGGLTTIVCQTVGG